jgi:hypothetical protein
MRLKSPKRIPSRQPGRPKGSKNKTKVIKPISRSEMVLRSHTPQGYDISITTDEEVVAPRVRALPPRSGGKYKKSGMVQV